MPMGGRAKHDSILLMCKQNRMARLKRTGKMETFSVSVSAETKARLRKAADRAYGGNVSALIESIALEADRHDALDWLLRRAPPIEDAPFEAFMNEMAGRKRKRSRRAA
jgi:post-segregation antitoxin (ccd killing protein)